ncbi:phosphoribosyl-dephospho-CoA transferase, partial [Pluralibacter gergoviae]
MTHAPQPHDLLWLNAAADLLDVEEAWVTTQWHPSLPVVVRRDVNDEGDIPVGVRGMKRDQRAAGWVRPAAVARA